MNKSDLIYVAGHKGLVGSAICRELIKAEYVNIITANRNELDLTQQSSTLQFFEKNKPDIVFLSAAKVGGILANNSYPGEFIYQNTMIESNIIHSSYLTGVKKLMFLGSSCIYPKLADQPITEDSLLTGKLEPTNEPYALAKILGIKMCQSYNRQYGMNFISAMPTNLYGINDNFDKMNSHVIPALIRKMHEAKTNRENEVLLWGSGEPLREFLFADDLANALIFLMQNYDEPEIINIGTGKDLKISELAGMIADVVGYEGKIIWDSSKPDGTMKKQLSVQKLNDLGWKYSVSLRKGLEITYKWFLEHSVN